MLARLRSGLAWALIGLGSACIVYPAFAYAGSSSRNATLTREVRRAISVQTHAHALRRAPERDLLVGAPRQGRALGILRIPAIGLTTAVLEGVTDELLMQAPGHVPGTALPGAAGASVIAAHRDMQFRNLKDLVVGDQLTFRTVSGTTRYRVEAFRVASGDAGWITGSSAGTVLRLVTCWPPMFVGPAPDRLVVLAAPVPSARSRPVTERAADARSATAMDPAVKSTSRPAPAQAPIGVRALPPLSLPPALGAAGAAAVALSLFGRWRAPRPARRWFGMWTAGATLLIAAVALVVT